MEELAPSADLSHAPCSLCCNCEKNRRQIKKYLWPINKYVKLQSVFNIAALSTILDAVNVFV